MNHPTSEEYWRAGLYALEHKEYAVARRCFEASLRGGMTLPKVWNNLGCVSVLLADYEKARWAFQQGISQDRSYSYLWSNYGRLLLRLEEWRSAAEAFSQAGRLTEPSLSLLRAEAYAWLRAGKEQVSIQLIESFWASQPGDDAMLMLLVEAHLYSGDRKSALTSLEGRVDMKSLPALRLVLAAFMIEQGRSADSLQWLVPLVEITAFAPRASYLYLLALLLEERFAELEKEMFRLSFLLTPVQALQLQAWSWEASGEIALAMNAWQSLVQLDPGQSHHWWALTRLLGEMGQVEAQEKALDQLLALRPQHPEGLWLRCQQWKNDPQRKKERTMLLDQLLNVNPSWAAVRIERGYHWLDLGAPELAIDDFRMASRLLPSSHDATLGIGLAYAMQERYVDATAAMTRLTHAFPMQASAWWNLGVAASWAEEWPRVIEAMERYLALHPADPKAYLVRAEAWYRLGKMVEAGKDWDIYEQMSR